MSFEFEWDAAKAEDNRKNHGAGKARIISARETTKRERQDYEQNRHTS